MRIGIDARELCGRSTGVGRYLSGLLDQWSTDERARRHEFVLYAHQPLGVSLDARRFPMRVVDGSGGTRWEQQQLLPVVARDHLDVFFAPGYTAPVFSRIPLVVAIHDVSFAAHPEWFSGREGLRRRVVTRRVASVARAITTLSEFSKRELIELLAVPADKIHIIRPGITRPKPPPSLAINAAELRRDSPPRQKTGGEPVIPNPESRIPSPESRAPRVLYVGSIFNRRHVPDLIRAFGQVARRHPDATLDLVGDDRSYPRPGVAAAIARERLNDRIRWHQYVSDADLSGLYFAARAFAFLSEYEGLGLTPLEALACGVPAVLLDTPVARESCAAAALYVPKGDIRATTDALDQLLFNDQVRGSLLAAAPSVLSRYDWRQAARQTLAVLEGAA